MKTRPTIVAVVLVSLAVLIAVMVHRLGRPDERGLDRTEETARYRESGDDRRGTRRSAHRGSADRGSAERAADHRAKTREPFAGWTIPGRVLDPKGVAVSGAIVGFRRDEPDATAPQVSPETTDAEGCFELRVPVAARGAIEVVKRRFAKAVVPWPPAGSAADAAVGHVWDSVEVSLPFETGIRGHVYLEGGQPAVKFLGAIQFFVDPWTWHAPTLQWFESSDGEFYYGGIEPGSYRVWAYASGYALGTEKIVKVRQDERVDDLRFDLLPGARIAGRVTDARTGAPVEGAVVYTPLQSLPESLDVYRRALREDSIARNVVGTDENGEYELLDLEPGDVLVRFLHPDYRPLDREVNVGAGRDGELSVALQEGPGVRGKVLDGYGQPVTTAVVMAFTMSISNPRRSESTMADVDAQGDYHIRNLNPGGHIVVRLRDPDGEGAEDSKVMMANVPEEGDVVVDFVEVADHAILRGIVRDPEGSPVTDMAVTAMLMGDAAEDFSFETAATDAEGRFEIRNLEFAEYSIGLSRKEQTQSFGILTTMKFTDAIYYDREFVFHDLKVRGRTTSGRRDQPVSGSEVIVLSAPADGTPGTFSGRALADGSGDFEITGLAPGRYRIMARASGFRPGFTPTFELSDGSSLAEVDVLLQPGATVEVSVSGSGGKPLVGAMVLILDGNGQVLNRGLPPGTDATGRYRYESLSAGAHVVVVKVDGKEIRRSFQARIGKTERVAMSID